MKKILDEDISDLDVRFGNLSIIHSSSFILSLTMGCRRV